MSYDPSTQGFATYQVDGPDLDYATVRKKLADSGLTGGTFYVAENKFFLREVNGEDQKVAPETIFYLSTSKAQINRVIRLNDLETLKTLLNPYNVSYLNQAGESFFKTAIVAENPEALRILLASGLTVKPHSRIIHMAIGVCQECVKVAIEYRVGFNDLDEYNRTPLIRFIDEDQEMVPLILQAGADPNVRGNQGFTALHYAVKNDDLEMVNYLIGAGADANLKGNEGRTPLHLAVSNGNKEIAWSLMNSNMDLNLKNGIGQTPLHIATILESNDILYLLLLKGADPNTRDNHGRTPLDYALPYDDPVAIGFLRQYGGE